MLKGSIPAIITPFRKGELDYDDFARLLNWQIKNGISGVTVCGTTGESPTLSHEEHMSLVEFAIKIVKKRIPVIAGTGSNSTKEAIEFTKHAYKAGANYGLAVTPYYNKPNQAGLVNHFKLMAKASPLKQIIYNIPGRSIIDLSFNSFKELNKVKNIVAIKDASNDLSRPILMRTFMKKNFNYLSGEDGTIAGFLAQGGHGCISVAGNVAPKLTSELHKSWNKGQFKKFDKINLQLAPLSKVLFEEPNPTPTKYALSLMGFCSQEVRAPLIELSTETKKQIKKVLRSLKFI
ncbi:MAG: 4-hydroxy-tetrahydrodipicolinate synthase [Pelagibacteraceae bacterium]|nr:4-hydroxy-tetrahydrodipicolinate synthase [Pelagibacteraceae bacterium]